MGSIRLILALALAFMLPLVSGNAPARAASLPSACHAVSDAELALSAENIAELDWICEDRDYPNGPGASWLRFEIEPDAEIPASLASRITKFDKLDIAALSQGEIVAVASYEPRDLRAVPAGPVFLARLPTTEVSPDLYIARIEAPHSATVSSEARLASGADMRDLLLKVVLLAVVGGMLIVPLFFDLMFYRILRERFVLLHAAMVLAMLGYLLFSGGLISAFAQVPLVPLAILGPLFWALGVGLSSYFMAAFLEEGTIPDRLREALRFAGTGVMVVSGFASLQLDSTQPFDNALYFVPFPPLVALYVVTIAWAIRNGSRSAWFLAAAWLPMLVATGERFLRGVGAYGSNSSIDIAVFLAMGVEILIVSLGVGDRFQAIRKERDIALDEAHSMTKLSRQDPLTGLRNRRAIEPEFHECLREGYTLFALLDLDRFKSINDEFGHDTGDHVLQATAAAMKNDPDMVSVRMGGEEFLVMVRGTDATRRAERLRQAITLRITREVTEIDRLVTASMGVVEIPEALIEEVDFGDIYARADRLLYEAKENGRNRTRSETLSAAVAERRIGDRRKRERRDAA